VLCLLDLSYLADFGLTANDWVDIYVDGSFKSFQIKAQSSIAVEKGRHVLLRLRPNALEELTDCPGLVEYTEKQPKSRSGC
jgi:hypothetical protein